MEGRQISCLQSNAFLNKILYFCVTGLPHDNELSINSTTNWNTSQSNINICMVYLHSKCNDCRINKYNFLLQNILPWSTWAEISTRKIFVHIPISVVSSFSLHMSVALFSLESLCLQLLWLMLGVFIYA
jgi:hypothetical protein